MKIRINQDVTFNWKLTVEGESVDLSKLELSVEITTPSNKKTEIVPTIKFDTLEFNYRPKQIGEYILSAYLNRFKDGETALDIKAFEGVRYSWNQDFLTDGNLGANYVELAGDFNFGPKLDIYKNITYTELVNLKNNAQLTSGVFYRITDYITTTTQENTRSVGHPFDVVVLAISESELSEQAWAIQHEGDTYFTNNDLTAWKIWYCLDNDTTRFAWADSTNGKGVIYRMIDEFNNDVPYDFKNIQFKDPNGTDNFYYFTFSGYGENETDYSILRTTNIFSNTISPFYGNDLTNSKQTINKILFSVGGDGNCYGNYFGSGCYNITLAFYCCNNTFGNGCYSNSLSPYCSNNTFGDDCHSNKLNLRCSYNIFEYKCYSNTLGEDCRNNTFRNSCFSNSLDNSCSDNSFGNGCYSNSFGNGCNYNSFGNGCYSNLLNSNCYNNSFGEKCYSNSFGNACNSNSFGNGCYSNSFDNDCYYNSFGNYCSSNSLGINCLFNSFGNGCSYIKFASNSAASNKYKYYRYNHFGDGCLYIVFTGAETASFSNQVQNYNFAQGVKGTSSDYLPIDGKRNRAYETYISKDTNDKVKESVIAEKLDKMIEISYSNLCRLKHDSELIPGQQYRIIDYDFTTTAGDTDSAHKLFDIIVTADSESILNKNARATQHQYMGAIKLYKTAIVEDESSHVYDDAVDFADYFLLAGTVEVDGVTYYRYDKYDHDGAGPELINTGRYILLKSIDLDSLNVSLDNPLHPVGGGTYSGDGSYVNHPEDAIVAYENGFIDPSIIDPLYERDLASWELKYTIENIYHSKTDGTGKGTILWMKDDYRNECNYDFINALFKVYKITNCVKSPDLINTYAIKTTNSDITYGDETKLVSTFGINNHDNIIKFGDDAARQKNSLLSHIVLGYECSYNIFGNDCYQNTIGDRCASNIFGDGCTENILRNDCTSNTFGNDCTKNILGDYCTSNILGNKCTGNTIRNNCTSNTLGNECSSNIFVQTCSSNTLGNYCSSNVFAKGCKYNIFGNNCQDNRLQTECSSNTFGNDCYFIIFASSSSETSNIDIKYKYNRLGDGCQYIDFKGVEQGTTPIQVQNYNFAQGLQGTPDNRLPIIGYSGLKYEMRVARNKNGDPKIYCIDN